MNKLRLSALLCLVLAPVASLRAQEPAPAADTETAEAKDVTPILPLPAVDAGFPPGAIGFAHLSGLAPHVKALRKSDLVVLIENSPEWDDFQRSAEYQQMQQGLKAAKVVMGLDVWQAVERLLGGEVAVAVYPPSGGRERPDFLLLIRPASQFAYIRQKLWLAPILATQARLVTGGPLSETRGLAVYRAKEEMRGDVPDGLLAVGGRWLGVCSNQKLLEQAVELLEGGADLDEKTRAERPSLDREGKFRAFRPRFGEDPVGRFWIDAEAIAAQAPRLGIPEKMPDGFASFLFGGLAEMAASSSEFGIALDLDESGSARFSLQGTGRPADLHERFGVFFPRPPASGTRPVPKVPGQVFGGVLYRDLAHWYRNREKYLQPRALPGFDQFETNIGNLLPGRDIGEDVLPLIGSSFTLVAARQSFEHLEGKPGIEFPAFAFIVSLDQPEEANDLMQLLFQTLLSVLNLQAAEQKREPWLMETDLHGATKITFARYLAKPRQIEGEALHPIFNFQPASARVGDEFVISSTKELCRELVDALRDGDRNKLATDDLRLRLDGPMLGQLLEDNRHHLEAAQIGNGRDADGAARDIDNLLYLLSGIDAMNLLSSADDDGFELRAELRMKERPKAEVEPSAEGPETP